MIGIIDYGMGNLRSVQKALEFLEMEAVIIDRPTHLGDADGAILPGVGAFRDAIAELRRHDFVAAIQDYVASGQPVLGICLGQQLLFEASFEDGEHEGLGLLKGDVVRFEPEPELKIPHMGWNAVEFARPSPLFEGLQSGEHFYFVHSYFVRPADPSSTIGVTTHGKQQFASIVADGNLYATQFHPEKSQRVGLKLLSNFAKIVAATEPVEN